MEKLYKELVRVNRAIEALRQDSNTHHLDLSICIETDPASGRTEAEDIILVNFHKPSIMDSLENYKNILKRQLIKEHEAAIEALK